MHGQDVRLDQNKTHKELVRLWENQNTIDLRAEQLVQVYAGAFQAIESRCLATLSRVTINVVIDRVLHIGSEKFQILSLITIEPSGLSLKNLIQNIKKYKTEEIRNALSYFLVEFLTVVGNITSDVLTASLHKKLVEVTRESALSILEVQSLRSINSTNKKRGEE
ncbi:MAG: hypothetical protein Q7U04_10425 [Bacteriovorax sp.]|nr:hypothetical protein [Bacteriovorax sp.]